MVPRLRSQPESESRGVLYNMQKAVLSGTLTISRKFKVAI